MAKPKKVTEAYNELSALINQLKEDALLKQQIALIEQAQENFEKQVEENYKKETEINTMIWEAIKEHDGEKRKNGINWNRIIECVIIAVLSSVFTYMAMRGFNV